MPPTTQEDLASSPLQVAAVPRFLQIAADLRAQITSGALPPGAEVPSERAVAARWNVARPTAARALQVLRTEGWTQVRRGAGTFVRDRDAERASGPVEEIVRMSRSASAATAALFGLEPAQVWGRHSIARDGLGALSASSMWFPAQAAAQDPRLQRPAPVADGELVLIELALGVQAVQTQDELTARQATAAESRVLGAGRDDQGLCLPCGRLDAVLERHTRWLSVSGQVVLVRETVYAPRAGALTLQVPAR